MHSALESVFAGFRASVLTPQETAMGAYDLFQEVWAGRKRDCEENPENSCSGWVGLLQVCWREANP